SFTCPTDHPPLHSFPTRRSSDLHPPHKQHQNGAKNAGLRRFSHRAIVPEPRSSDRPAPCERRKRRDCTCDYRTWMTAQPLRERRDRKSTRLNSSHVKISYAVFRL